MLSCQDQAQEKFLHHSVYAGFLPCDDCEGIEYHLHIFEDGTFRTEALYHGKLEIVLESEGLYTTKGDSILITTDTKQKQQFFQVLDSGLFWLPQTEASSNMDLNSPYFLTPSDSSLVSLAMTTWELESFDTLKLNPERLENRPFLVFFANGTVNGSTGCNRLFGSFSIENNLIEFSKIATTRMFCQRGDAAEDWVSPTVLESAFVSLIDNNCELKRIGDTIELKNLETQQKATFIKKSLKE